MTSIIARTYDSAHWYTKSGEPMYTVTAKDGSQRPTTLRDGRKLDLCPSVTTVLKIVAKPALDIWKQEQMLLAALTLPRMPDENEKDYIVRIVADSKETAKIAAAKGSAIHESIEKWFNGDYEVEHKSTASEFENKVLDHFNVPRGLFWSTEKSFGSPIGYGGKPDLYLPVNEFAPDGILLDTKSMDFDEDKEIKGYDENLLQLAAYRNGIGLPKARCANVYTSRTIPGLVKIVEWSQEDLERGWEMFQNLLSYWKLKNLFGVKYAK